MVNAPATGHLKIRATEGLRLQGARQSSAAKKNSGSLSARFAYRHGHTADIIAFYQKMW